MTKNFAFSRTNFEKRSGTVQSADKLGRLLIDLRETTEADKIYNIGDLSNATNDQLTLVDINRSH